MLAQLVLTSCAPPSLREEYASGVTGPGKMRDSWTDPDSSLSLKPSKARPGLDVMNPRRRVDMRMRSKCLLLFATEFGGRFVMQLNWDDS